MAAGAQHALGADLMVAWDPDPTGAAAGYVVAYGTASGVYTSTIDVGDQNRVELSGLSAGTTYYVAVRAYAADNTVLSPYSAEIIGVPATTANSFGVADPANEGSPSGVTTEQSSGAVTVLPVHDLAVAFPSVSVAGNTWATVTQTQQASNAGVRWGAWTYQVGTSSVATGPVTIGVAFDPAILDPRPGLIRLVGATMTRLDKANHIVWATVPSLPATVTVVSEVAAMNTDFNGDGNGDLLFANRNDGSLGAWLMNGETVASTAAVTPSAVPDTTWSIVGTGDFNGDGQPDLLWRNSVTGTFGVWLMNGTTLQSTAMLDPTSLGNNDWVVAGVADFNLDGNPDLLWWNSRTGELCVWFMNGVTLQSIGQVTPGAVPDTTWKVAGVADFDRDGHPDILWRSSVTGQFGVWLMNGTSQTEAVMLNPPTIGDLNWQIAGLTDLDGDGNVDVIWQNSATNAVGAWLMDGINLRTPVVLGPGFVSSGWQVAGPK